MFLLLLFISFLIVSPVYSATYFVDDVSCGGNDGSSGNPYCSVDEVQDNEVLACGDEILMRTGTYTTQTVVTDNCPLGTAGYITVKADTGHTPVIKFTTANSNENNAAFYFLNVGGWAFGPGLTFDGNGDNASRFAIHGNLNAGSVNLKGLKVEGNIFDRWGSNNRTSSVQRCTVSLDGSADASFSRSWDSPIVRNNQFIGNVGRSICFFGTINGVVEFNDITEPLCGIENGSPSGTFRFQQEVVKFGRYTSSSAADSSNNTFRYNHIGAHGESLAQCHAANAAKSGYSSSQPIGVTQEWYPLWCDVSSQDIRYFHNFIEMRTDNPSAALFVESRCVGARVAYNVVKNGRFLIRNTNQYDGHAGIAGWPDYFYNNILDSDRSDAVGNWQRRHEQFSGNNVYHLTGSSAKTIWGQSDGSNPQGEDLDPPSLWALHDNEHYYTPNNNDPFDWSPAKGGNSSATLDEWRTICNAETNGKPCDANSVGLTTDPRFVNRATGDYNSCKGNNDPSPCTAASPLRNTGKNFTNVVINRNQQLGTVLNVPSAQFGAPDKGIEAITVGTGTTISTSSIALTFNNLHDILKQCHASQLTIVGSTSGSRTASSITMNNNNSPSINTTTPLVPSETITINGTYGACEAIFAGVGTSDANTRWARSDAFTGATVTNTLSGAGEPPVFVSCSVEDATDEVVDFIINLKGGTLSPTSGITGFVCSEDGVAQTPSGTATASGNKVSVTFTNTFAASPVVIGCGYNPATGNLVTANGELVQFGLVTPRTCTNNVSNPPASPIGLSAFVTNDNPNRVIYTINTLGSEPVLPVNDCAGETIPGKTITDCDRFADNQFAIIVLEPFIPSETSFNVVYTPIGSGTARMRNQAGTELASATTPIDNQVTSPTGSLAYTFDWRLYQDNCDILDTTHPCFPHRPLNNNDGVRLNPGGAIQIAVRTNVSGANAPDQAYSFECTTDAGTNYLTLSEVNNTVNLRLGNNTKVSNEQSCSAPILSSNSCHYIYATQPTGPSVQLDNGEKLTQVVTLKLDNTVTAGTVITCRPRPADLAIPTPVANPLTFTVTNIRSTIFR